jgi:hypothetical protein
MTPIRKLAVMISNAAVRFAPPASQDWAEAISRELPSIKSDWAALLWALGGTRVLFARRSARIASLADVRPAASALEREVRIRTVSGSIVTVVLMLAFGRFFFMTPTPMQRAGCVLMVVAALFLLVQVVAWRSASIPKNIDLPTHARRFRIELERQRDFFSGPWLWSRLILMLPGYVLLCVGGAEALPATLYQQTILLAIYVAALIIAIPRSLGMARKYARQIAELDTAYRESQNSGVAGN